MGNRSATLVLPQPLAIRPRTISSVELEQFYLFAGSPAFRLESCLILSLLRNLKNIKIMEEKYIKLDAIPPLKHTLKYIFNSEPRHPFGKGVVYMVMLTSILHI